MAKNENFDFDPTSPTYVGRHQKDLNKHNVRDSLRLLEAVQHHYLAGDTVSTERLRQAAFILRVAADRLDREATGRLYSGS